MTSSIFRFLSALSLATLSAAAVADSEDTVQLQHASHVCNDEQETIRLAANDHLREMAKALVEFKATKYCFIMHPSQVVKVLEHRGSYIKFSHNNTVLYTFVEHILSNEQLLSQQRL